MNLDSSLEGQLPQPGEMLGGKYRVESVIGKGGMGVVVAAMDMSLGRRVAIKFLLPQKADRDGAAARFAREARAAASIQSEHVARIFEVSTLPNGASFIVMEHLVGADLGQVLASRGAFPISVAIDDLLEACEALGEAHGRGIVHRDLKPQNLFVVHRNDGTPCMKVLDFGISKAIDEEAPNLTSTNTVMGTPLYMSPEQVRSLKNVDHRSDIWALGAILFELITGAPVFNGPTMSALCAMIAMDPPTPLRMKLPDAPAELEAILLRCLHKDPNGRFQDVAALAEALAPFASPRGQLAASRVVRVVRASGFAAPLATNQQVPSAFGTTASSGPVDPARSTFTPFTPAAQAATTGTGARPSVPMPPSSHPVMPQTAGVGSFHPPGMVAAQPQGWTPHQTTQQAWQDPQGASGAAPARQGSSGLLFVGLGLLAGVVVLGAVGAGGLYVYSRQTPAGAAADPSAAAATAPASATVAVTSATATSASPIAVATPAAGPGATSKKTAVDAGVASPKVTTSASAAPDKPKVDEDLEAQKRAAQGRCQHMQSILRLNDPKNNDQAKQVKLLTCLRAGSPQGSTCERSVCRSACSMLQDQQCLFQLDNGERNFPAKF